MPRKPSQALLKKYDVEAFIERKVALLLMCDDELDILREDPERSAAARRELKRNHTIYEGDLPTRPEDARAFLEKCERLVEQPATSFVEYVQFIIRIQAI